MLNFNKKITSYFFAFALLIGCQNQEVQPTQENTTEKANGRAEATYTSYMTGDASDVTTTTTGGTVLMGGSTDVDEAIRWMIQKSGGGDFVVLRASGADGYNPYIYSELGGVNSVETILITSRTIAQDASVAQKIRNAEAVFIAGGDQANYVNFWKDTPVEDALNYLINTKKVPLGGTSAGCAIMSNQYYSALSGSITSVNALKNPYDRTITIGNNDFLNNPYLANTISDQHFTQRDRQGRLFAFMARMTKDWALNAKGIGVDEMTAVLIEANGTAKVVGTNKAYFMQRNNNSTPEQCVSKRTLTWNRSGQAVRVYEVQASATVGTSATFDLTNWTTGAGGTWKFMSSNNGVLTY